MFKIPHDEYDATPRKTPKLRHRVGSIWIKLKDQKYYVLEAAVCFENEPRVWKYLMSERHHKDSLGNLEIHTTDVKSRIKYGLYKSGYYVHNDIGLDGYSTEYSSAQTIEIDFQFVSDGPWEVLKKENPVSLPSHFTDVGE